MCWINKDCSHEEEGRNADVEQAIQKKKSKNKTSGDRSQDIMITIIVIIIEYKQAQHTSASNTR